MTVTMHRVVGFGFVEFSYLRATTVFPCFQEKE